MPPSPQKINKAFASGSNPPPRNAYTLQDEWRLVDVD